MRYLRKLRVILLAGSALLLAALSWLTPLAAQAKVPQAPNASSNLSVSVAAANPSTLSISGQLVAQGQPIDGARIVIALDSRVVQQVNTGGDGTFSATIGMPQPGDHVVAATYGGDSNTRAAVATTRFSVKPTTTTAPAPTTAPATARNSATVITATLAPSPVRAGDVLSVTGNLSSNGTPIDLARLDLLCDFGAGSAMSVTDSGGGFTATFALPPTGQPANLTVTVSYAGDGRFAPAQASFKAQVLPSATPTPVASASVAPVSSLPAVPQVSTSRETVASTFARREVPTPASAVGFALASVALYAFGSLCVVCFLAWRRHELLPGERRGFGSDFGRRHSA